MGRRFNIVDIDNETFLQIPKSLLTQKNYRELNSDAKIVYALLKDRMSLSRKNNWKDENGDIFLLFKQEDIAEVLGLSRSTISRAMKQLENFKLIDVVRQGLNRPNKIYICQIELVQESEISDIDSIFKTPEVPAHSDVHQWESGCAGEGIRMCTSENPDVQERESGCAGEGIQMCTSENPDVHQCNSGRAAVHANKTKYSYTEINNTDNNKRETLPTDTSPGEESAQAVVVGLKNFGITKRQVQKLILAHGLEPVQKQALNLLRQKKVDNPMGWLKIALEQDFDLPDIPDRKKPAITSKTVVQGKCRVLPMSEHEIALMESCAANEEIEISEDSPFYNSYMRHVVKKEGESNVFE